MCQKNVQKNLSTLICSLILNMLISDNIIYQSLMSTCITATVIEILK